MAGTMEESEDAVTHVEETQTEAIIEGRPFLQRFGKYNRNHICTDLHQLTGFWYSLSITIIIQNLLKLLPPPSDLRPHIHQTDVSDMARSEPPV